MAFEQICSPWAPHCSTARQMLCNRKLEINNLNTLHGHQHQSSQLFNHFHFSHLMSCCGAIKTLLYANACHSHLTYIITNLSVQASGIHSTYVQQPTKENMPLSLVLQVLHKPPAKSAITPWPATGDGDAMPQFAAFSAAVSISASPSSMSTMCFTLTAFAST